MPMMMGPDKNQKLAAVIIGGKLKDPEASEVDEEMTMAGKEVREALESKADQKLAMALCDLFELHQMRSEEPKENEEQL